MSKYWKHVVFTTLSLVFVLALAACSDSEDKASTPPTTTQPTAQATATAKKEPVELTIYTIHGDTLDYFNSRFGNSLKAKFPEYTIKYLNGESAGNLDNIILNKTYFDIFIATQGNTEKAAFMYGYDYDMTDLIKKHQVDLTKHDPAFSEVLGKAFNGRVYFMPMTADQTVLYYNKEVFDRVGAQYPKDGMTWNDILALSRKVTRVDNGVQIIGFKPTLSRALSIPQLKLGANKAILPTFNTDDRWRTLFQQNLIPLASVVEPEVWKNFAANIDDFVKGTLGIIQLTNGSMVSAQAKLDLVNFDVTAFPIYDNGVRIQPTVTNFSINKLSNNKDAAMEVIKYLSSVEAQSNMAKTGVGSVLKDPTVQKSSGANSKYKDKNWAAAFYHPWGDMTFYGALANDMLDIGLKYNGKMIGEGNHDFNTMFRQAQEEAEKKIAERLPTLKVDGVF